MRSGTCDGISTFHSTSVNLDRITTAAPARAYLAVPAAAETLDLDPESPETPMAVRDPSFHIRVDELNGKAQLRNFLSG
jgi:hypothetical protein